jgi:hypothetical protein
MGSCQLFVEADLEPGPSQSQPFKLLGLQAWATTAQPFFLFETGSHYVAQAGLKLVSLLPHLLSAGGWSRPSLAVMDFFFLVLELEYRAYTLIHSTSPVFHEGFFEIGSHGTICPYWL